MNIDNRTIKHAPVILAAALAAAHFAFLMVYFSPAISSPDANGYFAQARIIAETFRTSFDTDSDVQYVGMHWHSTDGERYYSKYPPGFPIVTAVVYRIAGPVAALLVNPLMASITLFLIFLISRAWLGGWWGLLAAALFAFNPTANQHALNWGSHTATLFVLALAFWLLTRWDKQHDIRTAFFTGIVLGVIPSVRYGEILLVPAFGLYMILHGLGDTRIRRSITALAAGFALPFGALLIRNQIAFGGFRKTGYSLMANEIGFGTDYFIRNLTPYLQQLSGEGAGIAFGIGALGIAIMCARNEWRTRGLFLAVLVIPLTLLYMFYYWRSDGMSMRFLLPTFPAYIIAGLWLVKEVAGNQRKTAISAAGIILALTAAWGLPESIGYMSGEKQSHVTLANLTGELKELTRPGDVIVSSQNVLQHLDYIGGWKLALEPVNVREGFRAGRRLPGNNPDFFGGPDMGEIPERFDIPPGRRVSMRDFPRELTDWADGTGRVFFVCTGERLEQYEDSIGGDFTVVGETDFTAMSFPMAGPAGQFMGRNRPGNMRQLRPDGIARGVRQNRPGNMAFGGDMSQKMLIAKWTPDSR